MFGWVLLKTFSRIVQSIADVPRALHCTMSPRAPRKVEPVTVKLRVAEDRDSTRMPSLPCEVLLSPISESATVSRFRTPASLSTLRLSSWPPAIRLPVTVAEPVRLTKRTLPSSTAADEPFVPLTVE